MTGSLPESILARLNEVKPDASFSGAFPKIQSSTGETYFVKQGSPHENEQYVGEVQSLQVMDIAAPGLAPSVLSSGVDAEGRPYLISEYKYLSGLSGEAANALGERLATELHQYKSEKGFGFEIPTYCGATRQKNGWYESWEKCYAAMIENLLEGLSKKGYDDIVSKGQEICEK